MYHHLCSGALLEKAECLLFLEKFVESMEITKVSWARSKHHLMSGGLFSVLRVFMFVSLHTIYKKCARVHALFLFLCVFESFVENIDITKV